VNRLLKTEMYQSIASCVLSVRSMADVKSSKVALKLSNPRVDSITHERILPLLVTSIFSPGGKGMLSGDTDVNSHHERLPPRECRASAAAFCSLDDVVSSLRELAEVGTETSPRLSIALVTW